MSSESSLRRFRAPSPFFANPTLIGLFPVFIWGLALPLMRYGEERIGVIAYIGTIFAGTSLCGVLKNGRSLLRLDPALLKSPSVLLRLLFFGSHELLVACAIFIAQRKNIPIVILINYLWPTAIILCSILLRVVDVTKLAFFCSGVVLVIFALSLEIVGPQGFSADLLSNRQDCLAYALALLGAVAWGFNSALTRRSAASAGAAELTTLFQIPLGLLMPVSFLPGLGQWRDCDASIVALLAGSCVLQYLAYRSWDTGMRRGNVVVLSLAADMIPWLSLLGTSFLLAVGIESRTIYSAALLVAGAVITRMGTFTRKPVIAS